MVFSPHKLTIDPLPHIMIGTTELEWVGRGRREEAVRFLGVWLDDQFTFSNHITKLKAKLASATYAIGACHINAPINIRKQVYFSLFESLLRFGASLYGCAKLSLVNEIYVMQKDAIRRISGSHYNSHTSPLFKRLEILKFHDLLDLERVSIVHKFKHHKLPDKFTNNFLKSIPEDKISIRHDLHSFTVPLASEKFLTRAPTILMAITWNALPFYIKSIADHNDFKSEFKVLKLSGYQEDCILPVCYTCNRNGN